MPGLAFSHSSGVSFFLSRDLKTGINKAEPVLLLKHFNPHTSLSLMFLSHLRTPSDVYPTGLALAFAPGLGLFCFPLCSEGRKEGISPFVQPPFLCSLVIY